MFFMHLNSGFGSQADFDGYHDSTSKALTLDLEKWVAAAGWRLRFGRRAECAERDVGRTCLLETVLRAMC